MPFSRVWSFHVSIAAWLYSFHFASRAFLTSAASPVWQASLTLIPSVLASSTSAALSDTLVGFLRLAFLGPSNRAGRVIAILLAHKICAYSPLFNQASAAQPRPPPRR